MLRFFLWKVYKEGPQLSLPCVSESAAIHKNDEPHSTPYSPILVQPRAQANKNGPIFILLLCAKTDKMSWKVKATIYINFGSVSLDIESRS